MGGLSWQTTLEKLREYFGQFGSVTDVLVMKDPVTQVTMTMLKFHKYWLKLIKYWNCICNEKGSLKNVTKLSVGNRQN